MAFLAPMASVAAATAHAATAAAAAAADAAHWMLVLMLCTGCWVRSPSALAVEFYEHIKMGEKYALTNCSANRWRAHRGCS